MERLRLIWNNKYVRATLVGVITFLMVRVAFELLPIDLPMKFVLALIPAGWAAYAVSKHYRYG